MKLNAQESSTRYSPLIAVIGASVVFLYSQAVVGAQIPANQGADKVTVSKDGTVHVPAQDVPMSSFLSPEAKKYVTDHLRFMNDPQAQAQVDGLPRYMKTYLDRQKILYPVNREDKKIAGVHVYVYTPKQGVDAKNKNRVLINLHGGGFSGCWPGCAELESIPIAGVGKVEVVAVDYRQGPNHKFPAASEDVASVYSELLKTHKPQNIGIYGCSAGGMLTAMSVAWLQQHKLPMPAAVGIFCAGAGSAFGGDADYTATPLGEMRISGPATAGARGGARGLGYLAGTDPKDPLVSPVSSPAVMAKFPPTLFITGTRGMELSGAVYSHAQFVKAGVNADLHVWEGLFHGFFYNPDVPESRDCYDVIVKHFDRYMAK
jgi:epsilon-lactone hydrolase